LATTPLAFNPPPDGGVPVHHIILSDISPKLEALDYITVAESLGISSTTFTQYAPNATDFAEITQINGHYVVQGHSRSPILVPIESSYDFLLVINTNLPRILHRLPSISPQLCGLSANLGCRSETCCTRLAEKYRTQKNCQKFTICAPSHNFLGLHLRN